MNKADLVSIRPSTPEDRNFILATWLKGLRFGNDWFGLVESGAYYKAYHDVVEAILNSPGVTINVACLSNSRLLCIQRLPLGLGFRKEGLAQHRYRQKPHPAKHHHGLPRDRRGQSNSSKIPTSVLQPLPNPLKERER
jgi:hypothetical protein